MEKLVIVNPFDINHLHKIQNYERENKIPSESLIFLTKVIDSMTLTEYETFQKESNNIELSFFIEDEDKIKDLCHLIGEKDRKSCTVSVAPIKYKRKTRNIINSAVDLAFNSLGMEEIFVDVDIQDKQLAESLEAQGFESLGEESGRLLYLKERELLKDTPIKI